jgi:hypothetical protein
VKDIVKVQKPLVTNDVRKLALVYSKGRKNIVQQALDDDTEKAMRKDLKGFFEAEFVHERNQWKIGKRVSDRDW